MPDARLPDIVNELQCHPDDLPPFLFRTRYTGSQTTLDRSGHLLSSGYTEGAITKSTFKDKITHHLNWNSYIQGSRFASPFISLLDDRRADRFAERCLEWPREPSVTLLALRTDTFTDVKVWKATDLVEELGIRLPQDKQPYIEGEYLCLFSVPIGEGTLVKHWTDKSCVPKMGDYTTYIRGFPLGASDKFDALSHWKLSDVAMERLDEETRKKWQEKRAKEPYAGGYQVASPSLESIIHLMKPLTLKDNESV